MNKNNKPIGVFDSGLGGLTVVDALTSVMPNEKFVYLGDTANMPYGTKTKEELTKCVVDDMSFLTSFDIKAAVIACNTADSVLGDKLGKMYDIPIFGVIKPAAKKAVQATKNKKIGVIATSVATQSGAYEREIKRLLPDADVISVACPRLVPLIEGGHFGRGDELIVRALGDYLRPMKTRGVDTLVLGCTHYPLLSDTVSDMLPEVTLVSSSSAVAETVKSKLCEEKIQADEGATGESKFYVTRGASEFYQNAKAILKEKIDEILDANER